MWPQLEPEGWRYMVIHFPRLSQTIPKLGAAVEGRLSDNPDPTSILSKVLGDKISDVSSQDIYTCCRMNLTAYPVQILTPQLVYSGLLTIDALDKGSGLSTPDTRILKPADVAHWSTPNHIFGETTSVVLSKAKSDYDYKYKT